MNYITLTLNPESLVCAVVQAKSPTEAIQIAFAHQDYSPALVQIECYNEDENGELINCTPSAILEDHIEGVL